MQAHPTLRFLVIGTGPDFENLKELSEKLGISRKVTFSGWLPSPRDVNTGLNASDIGLAMRTGHHTDNFHVTGALVHCMAAGLPVLAARLGGMSEIVQDGDSGYLFDPENESEFDDKLTKLIADPALRHAMGARSLQLAHQHFDIESVTTQIAIPLLHLTCPERKA
jgi:glycosyltransferase involved in cell wall biosynthesis